MAPNAVNQFLSFGPIGPIQRIKTVRPRVLVGQAWTLGEFVPIGVDGSRIDLPRIRDNEEGFPQAGRDGSGPQALMTLLMHLTTGPVWDWRQGRAVEAERKHRVTVAGVLRALRNSIKYLSCGLVRNEFQPQLQAAAKDGYARRDPKSTRRHPRKKKDKPPGSPKLVVVPKDERRLLKTMAVTS